MYGSEKVNPVQNQQIFAVNLCVRETIQITLPKSSIVTVYLTSNPDIEHNNTMPMQGLHNYYDNWLG